MFGWGIPHYDTAILRFWSCRAESVDPEGMYDGMAILIVVPKLTNEVL